MLGRKVAGGRWRGRLGLIVTDGEMVKEKWRSRGGVRAAPTEAPACFKFKGRKQGGRTGLAEGSRQPQPVGGAPGGVGVITRGTS